MTLSDSITVKALEIIQPVGIVHFRCTWLRFQLRQGKKIHPSSLPASPDMKSHRVGATLSRERFLIRSEDGRKITNPSNTVTTQVVPCKISSLVAKDFINMSA